jgi:pyrroloquinoline-quinone synthase
MRLPENPSIWPRPDSWWGSSLKRNLPPLRTHYGFTDHEVEFFAIHIDADEVHGERGYQIVERHCPTPEQQADAAETVREATEMRWQYMSGLHRAFVLKEDA